MSNHKGKYQKGHIWLENGVWLGKWREDVLIDGHIVRKQRSRKLAEYSDRFRCKSDVQPILDEVLEPLNKGKQDARSTMLLGDFVKSFYLPFVKENCKPSTYCGYEKLWRSTLAPRLEGKTLRDFRTVDAANLLADLCKAGLGRRSLQHAKTLLSGIFSYAKNVGALDGTNPVRDAMIPKKAKAPSETQAATIEQVLAILDALKGNPKARAAVGLMFYAGLRPGEARGVRWEDVETVYDPETQQFRWQLTPRHSVWRRHVTSPKTENSAKPVPVIEPLGLLLSELREADGNPQSGWILRGKNGGPLSLVMLSREQIKPTLKSKGIPWPGFYALRRGIATEATAETRDPLAAKGLLRHNSVATTAAHYIKDVPESTRRAMEKIEQRVGVLEAKRRQAEDELFSESSVRESEAGIAHAA